VVKAVKEIKQAGVKNVKRQRMAREG